MLRRRLYYAICIHTQLFRVDQHAAALHHGESGVVDQTRRVVVDAADDETERRR